MSAEAPGALVSRRGLLDWLAPAIQPTIALVISAIVGGLLVLAMGQDPHAFNPFPYPPTLLLLLSPLGGLSLGAAFAAFMIPSFLAYLWAMIGGRWRDHERLAILKEHWKG